MVPFSHGGEDDLGGTEPAAPLQPFLQRWGARSERRAQGQAQ